MRPLSFAELEQVAGGYNSSEPYDSTDDPSDNWMWNITDGSEGASQMQSSTFSMYVPDQQSLSDILSVLLNVQAGVANGSTMMDGYMYNGAFIPSALAADLVPGLIGDIVVTAPTTLSMAEWFYDNGLDINQLGTINGGNAPTHPTNSDGTQPGFQIQMSNHDHDQQAQEALNNVEAGVGKILNLLHAVPAGTVISWDGKTLTAGQLLTQLNNTTYIIDDIDHGNGGVGGAARNADGTSVDRLLYSSYSTTMPVGMDPSQWSSFAAPTYNGEGIEAILLHELGHMIQPGDQFFTDSWKQSGKDGIAYTYGSAYFENNEAFADDFMVAAATAIGANIDLFVYNPNLNTQNFPFHAVSVAEEHNWLNGS